MGRGHRDLGGWIPARPPRLGFPTSPRGPPGPSEPRIHPRPLHSRLVLILFRNLGDNLIPILQVDNIRNQQGGKQQKGAKTSIPPHAAFMGVQSVSEHGETLPSSPHHTTGFRATSS